MKNKLQIIAGPCSIDEENVNELYEIASVKVNGKYAISGVRIVGLKSRTEFSDLAENMGIDYDAYKYNKEIINRQILNLESTKLENVKQTEPSSENVKLIMPFSVKVAKEFIKETGLLVASEIMTAYLQLPFYDDDVFKGKFMPWNPAVNQLGWNIKEISSLAFKNDWMVGIKNGKWVGEDVKKANLPQYMWGTDRKETPLEKTWAGLSSFAEIGGGIKRDKIVLIHRGVDVPEKGDFRNLPVHNIAARVKEKTRATDGTSCKMFFDPSHTYGSKLKDQIIEGTLNALKLKSSENEYLYDGILIEVGNSKTDTKQHLSINELKELVLRVSEFRELSQ